jgi:hypothetical protein
VVSSDRLVALFAQLEQRSTASIQSAIFTAHPQWLEQNEWRVFSAETELQVSLQAISSFGLLPMLGNVSDFDIRVQKQP